MTDAGVQRKLASECTRRAASLQQYPVDLLRELIAIPSTSGAEGPVADRVLAECVALGIPAAREPSGTILGTLGSGSLNVVYDAHMDTVGPGEPPSWPHGPYSGKVAGGKIWGRGACDNKGALAAMLCGLRIARELGLGDDFTLTLAGVVEEELCEGWAIGESIRNGSLTPDLVVLGECTGLQLARGHRGRCEVEISTRGVSCHGSSPWRGRNAVYDMARWSLRIADLAGSLPRSEFLGPASVAVTRIAAAAGSPNVIPDRCTALVDRRTVPGESAPVVIAGLLGAAPEGCGAEAALAAYGLPSYTGLAKSVPKDYPAWELPPGHRWLRAAQDAVCLVTGRAPMVGSWEFSTDGVVTCGTMRIPTIGFGPGEEQWAHTVYDQVPVEHLQVSAAVYALLPQVAAWSDAWSQACR